jgi:hypothetical protein
MSDILMHEIGITAEGTIVLNGNINSSFKGPINKGLRLVLWGKSYKKATSIVFIEDINVIAGQEATGKIVLFSAESLDLAFKEGNKFYFGTPGIELGSFSVTKIIGKWEGKLP